jgi:hypothetical protein
LNLWEQILHVLRLSKEKKVQTKITSFLFWILRYIELKMHHITCLRHQNNGFLGCSYFIIGHTILHFVAFAFLTPLSSSLKNDEAIADAVILLNDTFTSAKEVPVERRLKSSKATTCNSPMLKCFKIKIQFKKCHACRFRTSALIKPRSMSP